MQIEISNRMWERADVAQVVDAVCAALPPGWICELAPGAFAGASATSGPAITLRPPLSWAQVIQLLAATTDRAAVEAYLGERRAEEANYRRRRRWCRSARSHLRWAASRALLNERLPGDHWAAPAIAALAPTSH